MVYSLHLPLSIIATDQDLDGTKLQAATDQWVALSKQHKAWYCSAENRDIQHLINENDTLFINSIFSHHFNYPALIKSNAKRKIISPRGMLDPGSLSQKKWKKQLYLAMWKLQGLHKRIEWHATTEQEKENIHKVFGTKAKVWVAPNIPRVLELQQTQKQQNELRISTIAVISPMKNHLLIAEALISVKEAVIWDIYGPVKDAKYWAECQLMISKLPSNIVVNYHGDVPPPDVPHALKNAHIAMLPSKSENFGHSIFEAMTAGKPVITSPNTPWNRLENAKAGKNVSINGTSELTAAISFFANMPHSEYELWSKSSRDFALASIDMEAIEQRYLEMFA